MGQNKYIISLDQGTINKNVILINYHREKCTCIFFTCKNNSYILILFMLEETHTTYHSYTPLAGPM